MKKAAYTLFLALMATIATAQNPYMPLWEHVPDGEPYVFEDPDNPGKMRVYVYGSHDTHVGEYCGMDNRVWSASVDDLNDWRDEGAAFTYFVDGQYDTMYAPDIAEVVDKKSGKKLYYLYPHSRGDGRVGTVCVGERPAGPFKAINTTTDGRRCLPGSMIDFDPGVLVDDITDTKDPDYERGYRAYVYWGFQHSYAAELDPETMWSVRPGTEQLNYFIPSPRIDWNEGDPQGTTYTAIMEGENPRDYGFFEASSIRKVGNKYVMIYSGFSGREYGMSNTNSSLRYAYGDSPLGPWRSGGVLVDSRGIMPNEDGTALMATNGQNNTHGSIVEINGQWYCFYHRTPRSFGFARQAMVAPIKVVCDKKPVSKGGKVRIMAFDPYAKSKEWSAKATNGTEYVGAEVTSEGFNFYGLDPYKYYSAGIACCTIGHPGPTDTYDCWNNDAPLLGVAAGAIVGFKYFGFGGLQKNCYGLHAFDGAQKGNETMFNLWIKPLTDKAFRIRIMLDGPYMNSLHKGKEIGVVEVTARSRQELTRFSVDVANAVEGLKGKHAIYLVAEGENGELFNLVGLGFSKKDKHIAPPIVPNVTICADGKELSLPPTPVTPSNSNGYTAMNRYQVYAPLTASSIITATATSPDVKIDIFPIVNGRASVTCTYKGQKKIYLIN